MGNDGVRPERPEKRRRHAYSPFFPGVKGPNLMKHPCRRLWFCFSQAVVALWLSAALLTGCVHHPQDGDKPAAKPLTQAQIDEMIKKKAIDDPFLRSQLAFGLDARQSAPDRIQATVTNKTKQAAVIGPKCFGLILPGEDHRIVKATIQSAKTFPITKVPAGDQVSGELSFTLSPIPAGARLAFFPIDGSQPAMAPIR